MAKAGSYTSTGTLNDTVTGLGFAPSLVMIKSSTSAQNWAFIFEDGSDTKLLNFNTNDAVTNTSDVTLDTDGFTLVTDVAQFNSSGNDYIYMAWK